MLLHIVQRNMFGRFWDGMILLCLCLRKWLPAQPLMQTDGTLKIACETCFLWSNSWQVLISFGKYFRWLVPLAAFSRVWTWTLVRLPIFSMLLLNNYWKFEVTPKRLPTLLRKNLMESSGQEREFQEGDGCQVSLPKMNLQTLQKKSGDVSYSTQLLTLFLP